MMAQAQSDADVKARMDALDAKVTALQTQNVVVDPNQLPDNVDPSMVVAPETAMLATSDDSHSWGVWIGSGFGILLVGFLIYVMFFRSRRSFA